MSTQSWTIVTLLAGGVFTGALSLLGWERVWLWREMTIDQFVVDFRRSLKRTDPAMPILGAITGVGSIGLASQAGGVRLALLLSAITCQLMILIGSVAVAEPINSQFRKRPEGMAPPGVEALRGRWRRLHLARSALALAAYTCIVVAVAIR